MQTAARRCVTFVLLAILQVACVSTNAIRLGGGPDRRPVDPEAVIIYRTAGQVPGNYDEIGLITGTGDSLWTTEEHMYKSLRKKAAALGANGVILGDIHEPGAATKAAMGVLFGVGAERKGKAVAIYVRAPVRAGTTPTASDAAPKAGKLEPPKAATITSGSGFFVTEDGYFVTAAHVLESAKPTVAIRLIDGRALPATIVRRDIADDLAVLKAEGHFTALPMLSGDSSAELRLGASVFTIGFPNPRVQGLMPKLTSGQVSATAGLHDDSRHYQVSVPVQPGNSGGPLIDAAGNVAGVVFAKLDDIAALVDTGSLPQTVNYAIKIGPLKYLLRSIPDLNEDSFAALNSKKQTPEQTAQASVMACALVVVADEIQTDNRQAAATATPEPVPAPTASVVAPAPAAEVSVRYEPLKQSSSSQGRLRVITQPPGAEVLVNGVFGGVASESGLDVWSDVGPTRITISKKGYRQVIATYQILDRQQTTVTVGLVRVD
jgi:S1-C subfamily serine protease